jgi:hypothetical protein
VVSSEAAALLPLTCMIVFALVVAPHADATDAGTSSALPACMQVTTDSRWVPYGYNHVVILKNGCSRAATCSVATDVNPERQKVDVAANTSVEVTTFMGSPSSTFNARVSCRLK